MKITNFEALIDERTMKKKTMIVLMSAFLLLSAFSCGGGNKANSTSEQSEETAVNVPQFDADSAYLYVKNQVDFGPRVPNTKEHVACGNYLAGQLEAFGAQVTNQYADLIAYDGTLLKARNIIGSYKPESKKRIALFAHWDTRPWADNDPFSCDSITDCTTALNLPFFVLYTASS